MKPRLLTPGPTPAPEETLLELARPVTFHRSSQFRAVIKEVSEDLQYVFCTKQPVLTITASGTGAMEAAIANTVPPGGKAICLVSGRWGERWRNICKAFGVTVVEVKVPYGESVAPAALAAALKEHPDAAIVTSTLSETATGCRNDIKGFAEITRASEALLIVDGISGLGVMECRMDDWGIDVVVTGSQKALMLPPGLAFIGLSQRAWKRVDLLYQGPSAPKAFYFDIRKYRDNLAGNDTPFTPANTLVRALRLSLKRLRDEGIENCWKRHSRRARVARAAAAPLRLELYAKDPADGLTVYKVPEAVDGVAILGALEKDHGIRVAGGQDVLKGKIIRLAHMGYIDYFEVLAAVSGLELTLPKFGHPVEPGAAVAACQRAYAGGA
ncbi:MAG: pyridoxal-phosphate-dependent aminotransferase family protein [Planctomycetota bacterium]